MARPARPTGGTRTASFATRSFSGTSRRTPRVAGGLLTITAKRETKANPSYQAGSSDWKTNRQNASYTSASLTTSGKQSWQYGRFEMCAKISRLSRLQHGPRGRRRQI